MINTPAINRAKLESLRDRHAALRAEYQRQVNLGLACGLVASRLRDEGRALVAPLTRAPEPPSPGVFVGKVFGRNDGRREAAATAARAAALSIFDLSADDLATVNADSLPAGSSDLIARIVDAEAKAANTRSSVARLAQQTRDARALLDRLEAFARSKAR